MGKTTADEVVITDEDCVITLLDEHGNIENTKKGAERTRENIAEKTNTEHFSIFYTKEDQEKKLPEKQLNEALANGTSEHDGWSIKKDGTKFWGSVIITALYNKGGQLTGFSNVAHCISVKEKNDDATKSTGGIDQRVLAELTSGIRHSEANLKAIFENSSESLFLTDTSGTLIAFNENARKTNLLLTQRELKTGRNLLDYTTEPRKHIFRDMMLAAASGAPVRHEQCFTDLAGRFHCYDFSINPVVENNVVTGICFNGRDITARKLAEEKTAKGEKRYRALVENGSDAVVILSADGHALYVSPSVERVLGYTEEEAMQLNLFSLTHPDDLAGMKKVIAHVIANPGLPVKGQIKRILHKDGAWHWYEATYTNMLHDPAIKGIVDNFRDITASKLAEEKIIHANRLYAFATRINKTIVHSSDEKTVFREACRIAINVGGFKMAWIGIFDAAGEKMSLTEGRGIRPEDDALFNSAYIFKNGPQARALHSGAYYVCNDIEKDLEAVSWKPFAAKYGVRSSMLLPIKKSGATVGTINLYSSELNFFDAEEILLLQGVASDISFALDVFENEKHRKLMEYEIVFRNSEKEKRATELVIANEELVFQNKEKEKRAGELIVANRLYAFISAINQTIVHSENEQDVFKAACRIAIGIGKFELALISIPDEMTRKLVIVEQCNAKPADLEFFGNLVYDKGGPTAEVFNTGKMHIINDYETEPLISGTRKFVAERGFKSCILLPIKKAGATIAVFNLYSTNVDLFDDSEIALLAEATGDISFALDVFEKEKHRKQMEDKVIHSELRLKQAQAIAHFGSWELDFATGIAEWSEEACSIYGLAPEDNIQSYQSWVSFIHPDDLEYVMGQIAESQETLSNSGFNHRIIRRDGAIRYMYSQAQFELNKEGKPIGLKGVEHDVTETKKAEEALKLSEANLRMIMDLIPQSIFAKDYNGKFVFANKSFASLYGLLPHDLVNMAATDMVPVRNEGLGFLKQDKEVILSGETKIIAEQSFTDHTGSARLFHAIKVPFTVAGTNEKAVLGIISDITEQKAADAERAKMIADIVQRNKELEQFSHIVSHNLRAPVANIIGIVNVMQTIGIDQDEEEKVASFLGIAAQNLDNVIRDLNHILEVKREVNQKNEPVQFAALVDDIISGISNVIIEEQVQIISDFSKAGEITTIKSYLHSIFYNLITNSIKYRQPDIAPVIKISSAKLGNKIVLVFSDNGLGINTEKLGTQVFGLYKRFHHHVEGKGIGLYMVKTQVETLGGMITMESEVNKGTEFRIEFEIS